MTDRSISSRRVRPAWALAAAAMGLALAAPLPAAADDSGWGTFSAFKNLQGDSPRSGAELRARRSRIRDALAARLGPEFRMDVPYASRATIESVEMAIERYQAIAAEGGWPGIPDGITLRRGDSGDNVRRLRHRLWLTGDLRQRAQRRRHQRRFDDTVEEAVARFQMRHGLRVSGFVDSRTRRVLNVPVEVRLGQLRTNLFRLRELAEKTNGGTPKRKKAKKTDYSRYVLVNVPSYTLQAVENEALALSSRVVVGKPGRETPSVSAKIIELNFFPYWRVPDSIAHRDLIPQLRKDPSYFHREHFSVLKAWGTEPLDPSTIDWFSPEVTKYKFRQNPGDFNALGVVRINMPNKDIVYLHDTPLKKLFGQNSRAFSSGCVRVERVLDLAGWLVRNEPDWSQERVLTTVGNGAPEDVRLRQAVPVHFVYVTAWATGNGTAHFRPDIYNRDGAARVAGYQPDEDAPRPLGITP